MSGTWFAITGGSEIIGPMVHDPLLSHWRQEQLSFWQHRIMSYFPEYENKLDKIEPGAGGFAYLRCSFSTKNGRKFAIELSSETNVATIHQINKEQN